MGSPSPACGCACTALKNGMFAYEDITAGAGVLDPHDATKVGQATGPYYLDSGAVSKQSRKLYVERGATRRLFVLEFDGSRTYLAQPPPQGHKRNIIDTLKRFFIVRHKRLAHPGALVPSQHDPNLAFSVSMHTE